MVEFADDSAVCLSNCSDLLPGVIGIFSSSDRAAISLAKAPSELDEVAASVIDLRYNGSARRIACRHTNRAILRTDNLL